MTLFIGSQVLKEGWASEQLIFHVEAPTTSQDWPSIAVNLTILPDYTRALPIVDSDNHALYISLGCALENLIITRP